MQQPGDLLAMLSSTCPPQLVEPIEEATTSPGDLCKAWQDTA
jgi:hypothetical protein